MEEEKVIVRGYVKWTDKDGVFHKEALVDHPELLAKASSEEQLAAEEVRRLNAAGEEYYATREEENDDELKETLVELKKAPEDVLTAAELDDGGEAPQPAAHDEALAELREKTS